MSPKSKGFTLIELLVVIAIIAIMAAIAMPNMSNWIAARRSATQIEQIANILRFARSEAVRLNQPVIVCPVQIKADGTADKYCNDDYKEQGLAIYANKDADAGFDEKAGDLPLRWTKLNSESLSFHFSTADFSGANTGSNRVWAFFPDGTFGHRAKDPSLKRDEYQIAAGYVKVAATDKAASKENKQARSAVLLIDSSGRVEVCDTSDSRELCRYPAKSDN